MLPKQASSIAEIKRRRRKVCICRSVSLGTVLDAIDSGCRTPEEVNARTRCGTGDCRGSRCQPVIAQVLAEYQIEQDKN